MVLFGLATLLAVAGQLLVLRDAVTGRTPAANPSRASRAREILWIALPAIALGFLLVATWRALPRTAGAGPVAVPVAATRRLAPSVD